MILWLFLWGLCSTPCLQMHGPQLDVGFSRHPFLKIFFQLIPVHFLLLPLLVRPWNIEAGLHSEEKPSSNTLSIHLKKATNSTQLNLAFKYEIQAKKKYPIEIHYTWVDLASQGQAQLEEAMRLYCLCQIKMQAHYIGSIKNEGKQIIWWYIMKKMRFLKD